VSIVLDMDTFSICSNILILWHYECSLDSRSALFLWSYRIAEVMFCTINNNNFTWLCLYCYYFIPFLVTEQTYVDLNRDDVEPFSTTNVQAVLFYNELFPRYLPTYFV